MKRLSFIVAMLFMCATGTLGLTPQAHAQNIIITGMEDYNYGTYTVGSGDQIQTRAVCVGKTAGNKSWNATINGSGAGNAFTLTDGAGHNVPFTIRRTPNPSFTAGVQETNLNAADNTAPIDCGGVDNQNFKVTLTGANLDSLPAGTYTGFIDITVSP